MLRCHLVCYDIRDEKRLRQIHRVLTGYGERWQYSVFFCRLSDLGRVRLESELQEIMNLKVDQVLFVDLGTDEARVRGSVSTLGESLPEAEDNLIVI